MSLPNQENDRSCTFGDRSIIDSASFYDFDIGSRNCSDRVVFCLLFILFDKQIQLFFLNSKQTIYKFKIMFIKKKHMVHAGTHTLNKNVSINMSLPQK